MNDYFRNCLLTGSGFVCWSPSIYLLTYYTLISKSEVQKKTFSIGFKCTKKNSAAVFSLCSSYCSCIWAFWKLQL